MAQTFFRRSNETRVLSPPLPASTSAVSVVAIDSISAPQDPPMTSQAAADDPGTEPDAFEVKPANPTTDDSFAHHETYFFKDGNITFLVDGTLYCVHRYFFARDSVYFSTKFSRLGVRDHEPLHNVMSLGDVERKDFEAFLSVIYPENFDEHNLSYEQWRSVLHLSSRWGFASLRKLSLRSVKPPTPCDQLLLARTYGVDHWVLPALSALCERGLPISLKEARQMSIEDVVLVATVREDVRNHHGSRPEIPLLIEATQARIAAGDDVRLASLRSKVAEKELASTEAVTTEPVAEGDSDSGSKTAATTEEDDKHGGDEHLAGATVSSLAEKDKQEIEQQEPTSEDNKGDRSQEDPLEIGDETSQKGLKKPENPPETGDDSGADKVKIESAPSDVASFAVTLSEEPEAQGQAEKQGRADEAAGRPTNPQTATVAEPQAPARATPLYWRRLTSRYMATTLPQ